jgi:hypothetical protein
MNPRQIFRFMSDNWLCVQAIWSSFESRIASENDLIRVMRPLLKPHEVPQEKLRAFVEMTVLSEFRRGGQGYSLSTQWSPIIQHLLNEQRLGLVQEIAINADHLKVHLADIEEAINSGRRTVFFSHAQAMQDRFQSLNRMVESNTKAIYRLVDEAKQAGQSVPLAERYEKVISAWDQYVSPVLEMKSHEKPFDVTMTMVRRSLQNWLADPGIHLLSTDDARKECDNILYLMLDFRERLDRSVDIMTKHLSPLVQRARVSTALAQGAALSFRDITRPDSELAKSSALQLPDKNRQIRKPDEDSLMTFHGELMNYSGKPAPVSVNVSTSLGSRIAKEQRDDVIQMLAWIKRQKPVSDIMLALKTQYPMARAASVTRVLSKLSSDNKLSGMLKINDDQQSYLFDHLKITMNRRSLENEQVLRPTPPSAQYTAVAFQ